MQQHPAVLFPPTLGAGGIDKDEKMTTTSRAGATEGHFPARRTGHPAASPVPTAASSSANADAISECRGLLRMLDRWENEGGAVMADQSPEKPVAKAGESRVRGRF